MSLIRRAVDPRRRRGMVTLGSAATGTVVVRLIGLISQAYALSVFGAGRDLDALLIALIVPNLLIVPYASTVELGWGPAYTQARAGPRIASAAIRGSILRRVGGAGLVAGFVLTAGLPLLVRLSAPGAGQAVVDKATDLAWWTYPSTAAAFVSGGCSTILFAAGRIQIPVLVQAVRPLSLIAAIGYGGSVDAMAMAVLAGATAEMCLSLIFVRALEGPVTWSSGSAPGPAGHLPPTIRTLTISSALTQAAPTIDQIVVSSLGPGSLVVYSLGSRFFDIGKAALVQPSARLAQNRLGRAATSPGLLWTQLRFEVRRALSVGAVAMTVVGVGAPLIVFAFFRRGAFSTIDARSASAVAIILAVGLVPWAVASVLARMLAIRHLTRAYLALSVAFLGVNIVLDLTTSRVWGIYGIAASTVTALCGLAALQYLVLRRDRDSADGSPALQHEQGPQGPRDSWSACVEPPE